MGLQKIENPRDMKLRVALYELRKAESRTQSAILEIDFQGGFDTEVTGLQAALDTLTIAIAAAETAVANE